MYVVSPTDLFGIVNPGKNLKYEIYRCTYPAAAAAVASRSKIAISAS